MKLLAVLLSLLGLSLLQEALCTHLETCECHEIREMVNMTVDKAIAGLEHRLSEKMQELINGINTTTTHDLENLEKKLTTTVQNLLQPIQEQLNYHLPPPPTKPPPVNSQDHPATSCKDLKEKHSNLSSGYYWIGESGSAVRVYCSMEETCGSETGGWMRVANIDMRNTSQNCPSGLTLLTSPKRLCNLLNYRQCVGPTLSVAGVPYRRVCGKAVGYQYGGPHAFYHQSRGIDSNYVFGLSLTHGQPRSHIWTFAGALDESTSDGYIRWKCPCIDSRSTVPSFVGNNYFCDTALSHLVGSSGNLQLETSDPLWDGQGCTRSSCCSFNTPPWFVRDLPSPTTDDIEMRLCTPASNGYIAIEIVELYVQ